VTAPDVTPLTAAPGEAALAATAVRIAGDPRYGEWSRTTTLGGLFVLAIVVAAFAGFFSLLIALALDGAMAFEATAGNVVMLAVALGFVAIIFATLVWLILRRVLSKRRLSTLVQLEAFAAANALQFSPSDKNVHYSGPLWHGPTWLLDHLSPSADSDTDYGTIGRAGSSGVVSSTGIGYVAIRLPRRLPHLVLRRGRGFGIVGEGPELDLEGDFARHFSLRVPAGYERDAVYLLTPDVMAVLIDHARKLTVEVVDDWLFVYSRPHDLTDPVTHERVHRLIDVVGAQFRDQASAYRDERVTRDLRQPLSVNRVAPAGRRLPPAIWIPGVIFALAIATSPFWGVIVDWLSG
jgi:hypothetical protein